MRLVKLSLVAAVFMGMGFAAQAELQNVTVDGAIRIRGNYYDGDKSATLGDKQSFVEHRTRLGVKADFTDDVSARIEFDSYQDWGGSTFRSDYVTGIDGYAGDAVNLYQAYINVDKLWGSPLSLRVGRRLGAALNDDFANGDLCLRSLINEAAAELRQALAQALHLLLDALHVRLELMRHLLPDRSGLLAERGEALAHLLQARHLARLFRRGTGLAAVHFLRSLCRHLGPLGRALMGKA